MSSFHPILPFSHSPIMTQQEREEIGIGDVGYVQFLEFWAHGVKVTLYKL